MRLCIFIYSRDEAAESYLEVTATSCAVSLSLTQWHCLERGSEGRYLFTFTIFTVLGEFTEIWHARAT